MSKPLLIYLTLLITPIIPLPEFDHTALLQQTLIPFDAPVKSVIYRLRAFDPSIQYPLDFTIEPSPSPTVSIEALNCTHLNSICQANVILQKKLEIGRFYDFTVKIQNQKGETAKMNCSFRATNATTPINEIFPGAPTLLMVAENARRNTELGSLTARGSFERSEGVVMELYGSPQFGLHQKLVNQRDARATIVLLGGLDYETTNVHHLTILANNPYINPREDTRNIASWPLLVAVVDIQDTPPIFTLAPPTTTLSPSLLPGDPILKIQAEDGDRGSPRPIRYGLVPEGNPFTTFFNLSEDSGELRLARPLKDILSISHSNQPIILTVIAEEVRLNRNEPPAQASTVKLALIPPGIRSGSPVFGAAEYSTILDENSGVGTILDLAQTEVFIEPGNVVALSLEGNNQTFEIVPSVVDHDSKFQIRVQNPTFLDYEKYHSVGCWIVAREIGAGNSTSRSRLTVVLNDLNDNDPEFTQEVYQASIPENPKIGTTVLRVEAFDIDRAPSSKIRYTRLMGDGREWFNLDPNTGTLTVRNSQALDAEKSQMVSLVVKARDEDGNGRSATAQILINLIDLNDETPKFEKPIYEFILAPSRDSFTTTARIQALDLDVTHPNNEVSYELIHTLDGLYLNPTTGELTLTKILNQNEIQTVVARAYDGGIPRLSSETTIKIYPPDSHSRKMVFIVPGLNPNLRELQNKLSVLTGANIQIDRIKPYDGSEVGAKEISGGSGRDRSVVYVTATYSDTIIDVNTVKQVFDETTPIATASAPRGNLLWLLILLLILALLLALILILCCICQGCPLYVPPKRRKVSTDIQKIVQGSGLGKESKSVQVAEWFGRREAWTPDQESLQRHEQERGSDRFENRRSVKLQRETSRDQLYIREGNTDILRLVTRGGDLYDSGKDILMKRFIDQQQTERVTKMHEHEILEASLRQQNALLRQILLEREKDLRLETQSLPAGTQTDQDQETQTEPFLLRQTKSDGSDEEEYARKERSKRKRTRLRRLKTPIQEESEIDEKNTKSPEIKIRQTKTSQLRQKAAASGRSLKKEVLKEISASLEYSGDESGHYYSDSLEDFTPRSSKTQSKKSHSETDLRRESPSRSKEAERSRSQSVISQKTKRKPKRQARYMEWYNKNKAPPSKTSSASKSDKPIKEDKVIKEETKKLTRLMKETESSLRKKVERKNAGPEHPLLQHSEHRFEVQYPIAGRKMEVDDGDSGIALARLPIAQKKSVFTIAYDDMHTSQLRPNSQSPV